MPAEKKVATPHPEIKGLIFLGVSLILLLSNLTYTSGSQGQNWLGLFGYAVAWLGHYLFGLTSYLVLLFLGWRGWNLLVHQETKPAAFSTLYFFLFISSFGILLNLYAEKGGPIPHFLETKIYTESILLSSPFPHPYTRHNLGGVPLYFLYRDCPLFSLQKMLSDVGVGLIFSLSSLVFFLLWTHMRLMPLLMQMKKMAASIGDFLFKKPAHSEAALAPQEAQAIEQSLLQSYHKPIYTAEVKESRGSLKQIAEEEVSGEKEREVKVRLAALRQAREKRLAEAEQKADPVFTPPERRTSNTSSSSYQLPPPSLLNQPKKTDQPSLKKDLRKQADILEETLMSFGIEAKVGEICSGPTISSFEVHPSIGVKVQKITALENDIALNLQAKSIRIIAPIPGKAAVGVEIPSLYPQEVSFKEMLLTYQNSPRKMLIPIILGKTVSGENVMSDLAKMPHCIIAGATGSGKSVCINTIILSILMNARPDEIKLLMVDPKKVELTQYTKLPHLIAPVITEAHGAYAALNWLVKEMQTRYDILKQLGLRNISAFNARPPNTEFESTLPVAVPPHMPAIVAIIDEFADLMMVSSSDLETPIARIAQMARAVGIHLILATQRPSREVITGLIKANFPTRIAFKVSSRINSQIILDETGAESLLGNGDMLFLPPGSSHLIRAQGSYVSDEEINRIVTFICDQAPTNYLISSFDDMPSPLDNKEGEGDEGSRDTLYAQALSIVVETQTASTTFLQRKLKIGYARAASLMDELEVRGVIGPQEGSKPRRVLGKASGITADEMPED